VKRFIVCVCLSLLHSVSLTIHEYVTNEYDVSVGIIACLCVCRVSDNKCDIARVCISHLCIVMYNYVYTMCLIINPYVEIAE